MKCLEFVSVRFTMAVVAVIFIIFNSSLSTSSLIVEKPAIRKLTTKSYLIEYDSIGARLVYPILDHKEFYFSSKGKNIYTLEFSYGHLRNSKQYRYDSIGRMIYYKQNYYRYYPNGDTVLFRDSFVFEAIKYFYDSAGNKYQSIIINRPTENIMEESLSGRDTASISEELKIKKPELVRFSNYTGRVKYDKKGRVIERYKIYNGNQYIIYKYNKKGLYYAHDIYYKDSSLDSHCFVRRYTRKSVDFEKITCYKGDSISSLVEERKTFDKFHNMLDDSLFINNKFTELISKCYEYW